MADRVDEVADQLHQPAEGETVAVLVSDRHDNIGMDDVVRAVADRAGATVVIDAGDDTSTGETWEAFSLDSLDRAFEGYDARIAISGNHDNGTFVNRYLEKRGWTHLDGRPVTPFGDVRITGVDDPRSSGLGNWRDQKGLSFEEVEEQIADDVCAADEKGERIATLVVHDANLGATALERGCTDLVLAGHLHVQKGPTRVVGANGRSATPTRTARPAGRRTPSRSGASCAATPSSPSSPTATAGRSASSRSRSPRPGPSRSRRTSSSTSADPALVVGRRQYERPSAYRVRRVCRPRPLLRLLYVGSWESQLGQTRRRF